MKKYDGLEIDNNIRTSVKYGIYTSLGLIIYFLLMKLFGLLHILELRFLNFFILAVGVLVTVRNYKKVHGTVEYLEGFGTGFLTSLVAGALFSFFVYLYLSVLDQNFMEYLRLNAPMGSHLSPISAAFTILIEATASGAVQTLLCLQYYRSHHFSPDHRSTRQKNIHEMHGI
jgi:hypothetical protein